MAVVAGSRGNMLQAAGRRNQARYMTDIERTRRLFLMSSAFVLGGCATSGGSRPKADGLPGLVWGTGAPAAPVQPDAPTTTTTPTDVPRGVIARGSWAKGEPIPARMNRMKPVRAITVHHDGMSAYTQTGYRDAAARLESIRRSHLRRSPEPFGDIGYHFAIDPAGRVWQGRPVTFQGAHVRRQNEGNLGIVLLGNYDKQRPNSAQRAALATFLAAQMRKYRVPVSRVRTHQEMAATACPGRNLQAFMVSVRANTLG